MNEPLPGFLAEARRQAHRFALDDGFARWRETWDDFVNQTCNEVPGLRYDPLSCLLVLGTESPGCAACRAGTWDCLFVTHRCNLNCPFCYSPQLVDENFCGSNLGRNPLENAGLYPQLGINAIAFTGGEALLDKERLYRWLSDTRQIPEIAYRWLYSNGLLLDEGTLDILTDLGLDELRINAAASGYVHSHVLEMMRLAALRLSWVTVEIPILPADSAILIDSLSAWVNSGVKNLNLHELLYEPGSNADDLEGERQCFRLPDGHETRVDPRCSAVAAEVFAAVQKKNLPLSVNYCSTVGKWRQITARREALMQSVDWHPASLYLGDGICESCAMLTGDEVIEFHPNILPVMRQTFSSSRFFRYRWMAPLSPREMRKHWISFEEIPGGRI